MSDSTRSIIKQANKVLGFEQLLHNSKNGKFYLGVVGENEQTCHIGIIAHPKGILIETAFPNQPKVHNRIWMLEPELEQISYLEIDNPDLKKNSNLFDYQDLLNQSREIEMFAMPDDINLLSKIVGNISADPAKYSLKQQATIGLKTGLFLSDKNN